MWDRYKTRRECINQAAISMEALFTNDMEECQILSGYLVMCLYELEENHQVHHEKRVCLGVCCGISTARTNIEMPRDVV